MIRLLDINRYILKLLTKICFLLRGKRDGIIGHISKRENVNWMEKFRFCAIDQTPTQCDWGSLP